MIDSPKERGHSPLELFFTSFDDGALPVHCADNVAFYNFFEGIGHQGIGLEGSQDTLLFFC